MRAAAIALMLGLLAVPAHALDYADFDPKGEVVRLYLKGVYEGYSWANADNRDRALPQLFCPPSRMLMTSEQVMSVLTEFYSERDDSYHAYPVELVILLAMRDVFPCD